RPTHVYRIAASRAQAGHRSARPGSRERRKQMDPLAVRLQEHLRYPGGPAEVAVDLKRRVRIEHVRIRTLRRQQHLQDRMRAIALREPGPHIDAPADSPTRRLVSANLHGAARSSGK